MPARRPDSDGAISGRRLGQFHRPFIVRTVEWREDEGHREWPIRGIPEQNRSKIRVEQRQFLVAGLFGYVDIRPEPVGRSILSHPLVMRWCVGGPARHLLEAHSSRLRQVPGTVGDVSPAYADRCGGPAGLAIRVAKRSLT